VTSNRARFFFVTSDIASSDWNVFLFLGINAGFLLTFNWVFSFFKRTNPFRIVFNSEKWNMMYGYIISIIIPLTLPWSFFMMDLGVRNFKTKLNAACYLVLYFVGLFFPIYYFFDLLQDREKKLISDRKEQ
jgi:hypothetical protein